MPTAGKLDETLRALAERGELTYLSVVPIAGKGGIVFSARYTPATGFGHGDGSDADPVEAILKAIADRPVPVKRTRATRAFGNPEAAIADEGDLLTP
jgi:hypothetical protein